MKRVALASLLLVPLAVWACGTVQQDDGPPPVAPVTRNDQVSYEPGVEQAPFSQDAERAIAARQALGLAGLDFGKGVLLACPGVKPPSFDYDEVRMQQSLEQSLEQLGRCAVVGRLGQSRLRLLVWDAAAGEALHALLIADGVQASRLEIVSQGVKSQDAGVDATTLASDAESGSSDKVPTTSAEWLRSPKVRVELNR
ncbi:MAG: hypothetical protein AB7K71_08730 [Polyangiaceae bacterium]